MAIDEGVPLEDQDGGVAAIVGRRALHLVAAAREQYGVLVRTLYYVARGRTERALLVHQMYEMGNRSVFFLTVVMGFIGTILTLQAGLQTRRVVPDLSMLGASYLELLVRDLAASIVALMLATRIGAGIAAEIGSMVVTEQVDALRMCAADPIDYLVKPRFIASVLMTVCLIVWSATVAFFSGMLTAYAMFDLRPDTFINVSMV